MVIATLHGLTMSRRSARVYLPDLEGETFLPFLRANDRPWKLLVNIA